MLLKFNCVELCLISFECVWKGLFMFNIKSMTGFADHSYPLTNGTLDIKIRAVNCRFMEVNLVVDPLLQFLEKELLGLVKQVVQRGKLDITITLQQAESTSLQVDQSMLSQLGDVLKQLKQELPQGSIDLMRVLEFPNILQRQTFAVDNTVKQQILDAFTDCLLRFDSSRIEEGTALSLAIASKLDAIDVHLEELKYKVLRLVESERQRILNKINQLGVVLETSRLEQEVAIQAQRCDIAEEYDRLNSHVQTVRSILATPSEVNGKRIDFISQELLRESNTIASKSSTLGITQLAVDLKVLSEQIREQTQNIE